MHSELLCLTHAVFMKASSLYIYFEWTHQVVTVLWERTVRLSCVCHWQPQATAPLAGMAGVRTRALLLLRSSGALPSAQGLLGWAGWSWIGTVSYHGHSMAHLLPPRTGVLAPALPEGSLVTSLPSRESVHPGKVRRALLLPVWPSSDPDPGGHQLLLIPTNRKPPRLGRVHLLGGTQQSSPLALW